MKRHENTIIIGAGQSGLATGYYLKQLKIKFLILDESEEVGAAWDKRWDTLKLFTPSQYNGLPGYPFPAPRGIFPTKGEMAGYLKEYAIKFDLAVCRGTKVISVRSIDSKYEILTDGESFTCDNLVIATGGHQVMKKPACDELLAPSIYRIYSTQYQNPTTIPSGNVLVVGAGASGVQIAIDLSKTHKVYLAGKPTFHIPDFVFRYLGRFYWWFINNVLTIRTPMGRNARKAVLNGGGPLINVSVKDVEAAGIERLPRLIGNENGQPKLENGKVIQVNSIIYATGFKPDFSWINTGLIVDKLGWPETNRGISNCEGLYFVGMIFQFSLTSAIIGGVGRDAEFIAKEIAKRIEKSSDKINR